MRAVSSVRGCRMLERGDASKDGRDVNTAATAFAAAAASAAAASAAAGEAGLRHVPSGLSIGRMVGWWIERATTAEAAAETAEAAATEAATTEPSAADDAKGDGAARLLRRGGLSDWLLREEHELGDLLGIEGRLLRHGAAAGVRHFLVGGEGLPGAIGRAHARVRAQRALSLSCLKGDATSRNG